MTEILPHMLSGLFAVGAVYLTAQLAPRKFYSKVVGTQSKHVCQDH